MKLRKNFAMGKGKYYFTIKSVPNNITIFRKSKDAAIATFKKYQKAGKEIEWLGKWDGKKFVDSSMPAALAS